MGIVVEMPNPQFTWSSSSVSIATIDKDIGKLHALALGSSNIRVRDNSILFVKKYKQFP